MQGQSLMAPGPFNLAAMLPMNLVKKILDLEFVEMSELTTDAWQDDTIPELQTLSQRLSQRAPVTDISVWSV